VLAAANNAHMEKIAFVNP